MFRINLLGLLLLLFTLDGCQFLFFCYKFYSFYYSFCCSDFSVWIGKIKKIRKKKLYYFGNMVMLLQKKRKEKEKIIKIELRFSIFKWNVISFLWTLIINRFPTNQGSLQCEIITLIFSGKPWKNISNYDKEKILRFLFVFCYWSN